MLASTNSTLKLAGISGNDYLFNLYTFESFEDLKNSFIAITAIYLFTQRIVALDGFEHNLIYLGETGDLSTRFSNHHKEDCITAHRANCIGIFVFNGDEEQLKNIEIDILSAYDFPCNTQNN